MTKCSFCDTEMLNVKLEMLVEKAGTNGLEVGIGFAPAGGFYAFLLDAPKPIAVTGSYVRLDKALAALSMHLAELLARFPERRV